MFEFLFGQPDVAMGFIGAIAGLAGKALGAVGLDKVLGFAGDKLAEHGGQMASQGASIAADKYAQEQAEKFQREEREHSQTFSAKQAAIDRQYQADQVQQQMDFQDSSIDKQMGFADEQAKRQMAFQDKNVRRQLDHQTASIDKQQDFQADQVKQQMAFQRDMASTQTQRAAKDMEKAGLNRVLALGQPAAAPAGAAGTGSSAQGAAASGASGAGSSASGGAASGRAASSSGGPGVKMDMARNAIAAASAKQTIENQKEQKKLLGAQTYKTRQEGRAASAIADKEEMTKLPYQFLGDNLGRGGDAARNIQKITDGFTDTLKSHGRTAADIVGKAKKGYMDNVRWIYDRATGAWKHLKDFTVNPKHR